MIKMSLLLQFYDQKYPLKMIFCLSFWKFLLEKVFWKISRARLAPRVCVFLSNKPVSSGHFVMNTVRVSTVIWSSRVVADRENVMFLVLETRLKRLFHILDRYLYWFQTCSMQKNHFLCASSSCSTVFENHRKSLIQLCEWRELRLHFEWTKVY